MKTTIFGYSDDNVELGGAFSEEYGCYKVAEKGIKILCSDGTKAKLTYDGEWKFTDIEAGKDYEGLILSVGDDAEHTDVLAKGCTSYSDVMVLSEDIEWIKINGKTFQK